MKHIVACLALLATLMGGNAFAQSAPCQGKFPNPITDICWSCVLPLTIGSSQIFTMSQEDNGSGSSSPVCTCSGRVGLSLGFNEPSRIAEIVRRPYCFPTLGGINIDFGVRAPKSSQTGYKEAQMSYANYHVHWYINPLMFWLEVMLDSRCLEQSSFDLGYLTELDPFWLDSETSFILNADVILFGNPVAQAACAVDCISASTGFPRRELFWCAGCQGSMYPLTGWVSAKIGGVQASKLLMQRFTNKLHREGLMWAASSTAGQCGYYIQPLMDKTNYKEQMLYPVADTTKIAGKCCAPYGRTSVIQGAGKEFPVKGEDFTYQIFRKRDCCGGSLF